jgi:hypothetical protein
MPRIVLQSTLLQAAAYQDECLLELQFNNGAVYQYFGVPAQIYQDLLQAESKGRYFNFHIRNRFAYVRMRPAEPTAVPMQIPCRIE